MKKIFINFYSAGNLGDDLFIKTIADYFDKDIIFLRINPKYKIKDLPRNVRILYPLSFMSTLVGKMNSMSNIRFKRLSNYLEKHVKSQLDLIEQKVDANVMIGGSIFMQNEGQNEINFEVDPLLNRDYSIKCDFESNKKNKFIIGANLGPIYDSNYIENIKKSFSNYANVCVRDYASYKLVENLKNVQYAPDTVFNHKVINKKEKNGKRAFISLIDPRRNDKEKIYAEDYFQLIRDTVNQLIKEGFKIDLVSFCNNEGDKLAVDYIYDLFNNNKNIEKHYYKGDINKILYVLDQSDLVIGTRFHSFILGFIYNKPTFPISYNCKTVNYLNDLNFTGKYVKLDEIKNCTVDDVLYNYRNNIICNCDLHKRYAKNQFYALEMFLRKYC